MAALSQESITCAICSDPLKDPLALPCGHSYCRDCIEGLLKTRHVPSASGLEPEPISRQDFLTLAKDITLDPNTVNPYLDLSDENRRVTGLREPLSYPDHPDRFSGLLQALSREPLTGRCYWELEFSEMSAVDIAVSYRDIHRKSIYQDSWFGCNDQSWALQCCGTEYGFRFNGVISEFLGPVSQRFGVYLDHRAGVLSFYSVQDQTMTLLHRVQTQFTKPLYAGVGLPGYGTVHFIRLK